MSKLLLFLVVLKALLVAATPQTELSAVDVPGGSRRLLQARATKSTVTTSAANFVRNGQWVNITWQLSSAVKPHPSNIIAVYLAPLNTTFAAGPSLKYKPATSATGTASFRLLNLRQNYQFALVSNSTGTPTVLAASAVLVNVAPNQPTGIHVSPGSSPTTFTVQWVTRNAQKPAVQWGTSANNLKQVSLADSLGYTKQKILNSCGWGTRTPPADANMKSVGSGWLDPGSMHLASLAGVQPGVTYFYRIFDQAVVPTEATASPVLSFTAPPSPSTNGSFTMLVAADLGVGNYADNSINPIRNKAYGAYAVIQGMKTMAASLKPKAISIMGDLTYSDGTLSFWPQFADDISPIVSRTLTFTCAGNHERDYYYSQNNLTVSSGDWLNMTKSIWYGGECGIPYESLYRMPGTTHTKTWYSLDIGPVHFLAIDTELNMEKGSPQWQFAAADLAAVNRTKTPFVAINMHRPIYPAIPETDSDYAFGQRLIAIGWDKLFFDMKVDTVLTGHNHVFSRTCPILNNTCVPDNANGTHAAPINICTGWGGPTDADETPVTPDNRSVFPYIVSTTGRVPAFGFLKLVATRKQMVIDVIQVDWTYNNVTKSYNGTMKPLPKPFESIVFKAKF